MKLRSLSFALLLWPALAGAAWQLQPSTDAATPTRAVVVSEKASRLEVFRDDNGKVYMEFSSRARGGLERSSCPTFQVDQRLPQHFYRPGAGCSVSQATARYELTEISGNQVTSLVLYRLLNGSRIAFRYRDLGGTYHQDTFSLSRSKQALLGALGKSLVIEPGTDE